MEKCRDCDKQISKGRKCGLCKICYARDYRKRNKEKIKPVARAKYLRRREYFIDKVKEWHKKNNYATFKTGKLKERNLIRRKTRHKYPLEGNTCEFCSNAAERRHHTTEPMQVDEFIFLCKKHHDEIHGKKHVSEEEIRLSKLKRKEVKK